GSAGAGSGSAGAGSDSSADAGAASESIPGPAGVADAPVGAVRDTWTCTSVKGTPSGAWGLCTVTSTLAAPTLRATTAIRAARVSMRLTGPPSMTSTTARATAE